MIVLNDAEMHELIESKQLTLKVEVQGYDVFELVTDGFYKDMYLVHGNSLYDVHELDENDNIISITEAGTYERNCVLPKFIKNYCPFTKGHDIINIHDKDGVPVFSVLTTVSVLTQSEKYYWNINLVLV